MDTYEEKEVEIDVSKKYGLPNFSEIKFKGVVIVIFPDIAKWLILENDNQYIFWNLLKVNNISDSFLLYHGDKNDAAWVIAQLEGKDICDTIPFEKNIEPSLQFHITNKCNLSCPHCYMNAGVDCNEELSTEEILNVIKIYSGFGKKLIISGGEPSSHPHFKDIVKYAFNLGLRIEILTNGILWSDDLISEIGSKASRIQISIDGYNEIENSKIRGVGTFDKIIDSIRLFNKHKINLEIAITPFLDSHLESKVDNYAEFGKWLMSEFKNSVSAINFTGDILDGRNINYSVTDKLRYKHFAQEVYKKCYNRTGDEAFIAYHQRGGLEGQCNFGNLSIKSNGDIFFCPLFQLQKPFGNVKNIDLSKLFSRLEIIKARSHVSHLSPCHNCDLRFICGGECKVKYFEFFQNNTNLLKNDGVAKRRCTNQTKEFYYNMLIRTNEDTLM